MYRANPELSHHTWLSPESDRLIQTQFIGKIPLSNGILVEGVEEVSPVKDSSLQTVLPLVPGWGPTLWVQN